MHASFQTDKDEKWGKRVDGLLNAILSMFFPQKYGGGNVFVEITCEPRDMCDNNQKLFKGFVSMWMAMTTLFDKSTKDKINGKLESSAAAAAKQCSGEGGACGLKWYDSKFTGKTGLEEEMTALALFSSLLVKDEEKGPVTSETGGKSESNPDAGTGSESKPPASVTDPITTGDKVGASFLTLFFIIGWGALMAWMLTF